MLLCTSLGAQPAVALLLRVERGDLIAQIVALALRVANRAAVGPRLGDAQAIVARLNATERAALTQHLFPLAPCQCAARADASPSCRDWLLLANCLKQRLNVGSRDFGMGCILILDLPDLSTADNEWDHTQSERVVPFVAATTAQLVWFQASARLEQRTISS
jgi:hypothetical protein